MHLVNRSFVVRSGKTLPRRREEMLQRGLELLKEVSCHGELPLSLKGIEWNQALSAKEEN